MAAKVAIHRPSLFLLTLALIPVIHTMELNKTPLDYSVNMTLQLTKVAVKGSKYPDDLKAINVTCLFIFNENDPSVIGIGLDRRVTRGRVIMQEKLLETRGEGKDRKLVSVMNFGTEVPRDQYAGSFEQRWLNYILANISEEDFGDYMCYIFYRRFPDSPYSSVTDYRTVNYGLFDDIKAGAQKEFGELVKSNSTNFILFSVRLGAAVIVCTLSLAGVAAIVDKEKRDRIRNQLAAAAKAALAAEAAEAAATAATAATPGAAGPSIAPAEARPSGEPAVTEVATADLPEVKTEGSSENSQTQSPEPRPIQSQSAPVVLEMVPLTLEGQSPTPSEGTSDSGK